MSKSLTGDAVAANLKIMYLFRNTKNKYLQVCICINIMITYVLTHNTYLPMYQNFRILSFNGMCHTRGKIFNTYHLYMG